MFEDNENYGGEYKYAGKESYRVDTMAEAWKIADEIFPCEFNLDADRSMRAGCPIYYGTKFYDEGDCWISDLGRGLEVRLPDATVNIWVSPWVMDDKTHGSELDQMGYDQLLVTGCVEMPDEEAKKAISDLTGFAENRIVVKHIATVRKCIAGDPKTGYEDRHARVPLRNGDELVYALFEVEGKCNGGQWEVLNTKYVEKLHRIERI